MVNGTNPSKLASISLRACGKMIEALKSRMMGEKAKNLILTHSWLSSYVEKKSANCELKILGLIHNSSAQL